jgi:omega-hydroxy-beta-dihydromenaquinone-9 sulfotransferase
MEGVDATDLKKWKQELRYFVAMQMYRKQKGLVLKSPTHTGRLQLLAEMFPSAKFVHITRDPHQLFSSTQRLWATLDEAQGLQIPREENLDEYVFTALERMYRGFERQRLHVEPSRICDIRYEQLISNPVASLRQIYEHLNLGDFERVLPKIEQSMQQRRGHKSNRHELPSETKSEIGRRWADYCQRYGYSTPSRVSSSE